MEHTIDQFSGEYRFLSNFWPLISGGRVTSEHLYQAAKTMDKAERKEVMAAPTPGAAKRLGRTVTVRPDWDDVRVEIMLDIVRYKFEDRDLATLLIGTGETELIEGNTWGDTFWGVDLATGEGENHLGLILMQVRDELRTEPRFQYIGRSNSGKIWKDTAGL